MFKKITSVLLAISLVVTMSFGGLDVAKAAPKEPQDYVEGEVLVLFKPDKALSTFSIKSASHTADFSGDINIKEVWQFTDTAQSKAARKLQKFSAKNNNKVKATAGNLNIALVKSKTLSTEQMLSKIKGNPAIAAVEPNRIRHASVIDDEYFESQWGLKNTGQNNGNPGLSTNAITQWNQNSSDNVVAVIDSGVDYTHPDLKNQMWENSYYPDLEGRYGFDFCNHDNDPIDDHYHGTHCAGIIAAEANNNIGIAGVNPSAKIMALKMLDEEGSGADSAAIGAYNYIDRALDLGVNICAINNSWGGGGNSVILDKVVSRVGEKGAVSCFASGNESFDLDQDPLYKCVSDDNPHVITINALNEKNQLANFSNYGKSTTQIGAPGVNILSTVSMATYNPSIYSKEQNEQLSHIYENFNDKTIANAFGVPQADTLQSSLPDSNVEYNAELTDNEFFGHTGHTSLKLTFKNLRPNEFISVSVPYQRDIMHKGSSKPSLSIMTRATTNNSNSSFAQFGIVDSPDNGTYISENDYIDKIYDSHGDSSTIRYNNNLWSQMNFESCVEKNVKNHRLFFGLTADVPGTYTVYIDDIGISKALSDPSVFGKYKFANGTSMATPFVTGAISLIDQNEALDGSTKIHNLLKHINKDPNLEDTCEYSGNLDLSKTINNGPTVTTIDTNFDNKTIVINGYDLDSPNLEVTFNNKPVEIIEQTNKRLVIKDDHWLNNYVNIKIVSSEKTITKPNVYLVHSKPSYDKLTKFQFPSITDAFATDGRYIYSANSDIYNINRIDTKTGDDLFLGHVPLDDYFPAVSEDENSDFENIKCKFLDSMVYADGYLYNIACQYASSDIDDEFGGSISYASKYRLIKINVKTGQSYNLGQLPSTVRKIDDYTLGAYNGKIYLAGGYDHATHQVSTQVQIYNPATKKWSKGPSLPEGRAGGYMYQHGNQLIYTLGYSQNTKLEPDSEQNIPAPANLVLSASNWKLTDTPIPVDTQFTVNKEGTIYNYYYSNVGLCKDGLVYAGFPAKDLGDTFIYNVSKDQYEPLAYQYAKHFDIPLFIGLAVGDHFYGTTDEGTGYSFKINSGAVSIKSPKNIGGKVYGANLRVLPGNKVTVRAVPNKGHFLHSLKINGVKQNLNQMTGKGKTIRLIENMQLNAKFGQSITKINLNKTNVTLKAGKTFKIKATVLPTNAYYKGLTYQSANPNYATVNANGLVTAKKTGIGKTVKITVRAKTKSKVYKNCYIKVIK